MSSKFLSSDSATSLASLQDGTFNLSVASASMSDLTPGLPVKTNSDKKLVSGLIEPDEINATILTNPLIGTLEATDFKTSTTSLSSIETKTQQIQFAPTYVQGTAIVGRLGVFAPGQDPENPADSPEGQILCGTLRSTTLSALSGPTIVVSSNLDLNSGSVSASVINGVVHVRSDSELPTTLAANTSYIIHGTITTASTLTVSADGCSISGHDRTKDKLVYTGTGTFLTVTNVNFSLENVGITASTGKAMSATNYTTANYNRGRDKVLSLVSCEFRNCQDVWDIVGFDLCDILNCLVWYCTGTTGCTFQDTSKLQITSSEFIRWFSESSIPTPSSYSTATMIELKANGADNAGFGAISISSCIMHPQQTQKGISVSSSSTAGFATISAMHSSMWGSRQVPCLTWTSAPNQPMFLLQTKEWSTAQRSANSSSRATQRSPP